MSFPIWLAFFLATFLLSLSPGMGALATVNAGLSQGMRLVWRVILGLQLALTVELLLVALGTDFIQAQHQDALLWLRQGGAAYLAYLGLSQIVQGVRYRPTRPTNSLQKITQNITQHNSSQPTSHPIWQGFCVNLVNPKSLIFMAAFVPQFIRPNSPLWLQYSVMGVTMVITDVVIMLIYGSLASHLRPYLEDANHARWRDLFFGVAFVLFAFALLIGA